MSNILDLPVEVKENIFLFMSPDVFKFGDYVPENGVFSKGSISRANALSIEKIRYYIATFSKLSRCCKEFQAACQKYFDFFKKREVEYLNRVYIAYNDYFQQLVQELNGMRTISQLQIENQKERNRNQLSRHLDPAYVDMEVKKIHVASLDYHEKYLSRYYHITTETSPILLDALFSGLLTTISGNNHEVPLSYYQIPEIIYSENRQKKDASFKEFNQARIKDVQAILFFYPYSIHCNIGTIEQYESQRLNIYDNVSPLFASIYNQLSLEIIRTLLSLGADPNQFIRLNGDCFTILDFCYQSEILVELLRKHGGKTKLEIIEEMRESHPNMDSIQLLENYEREQNRKKWERILEIRRTDK